MACPQLGSHNLTHLDIKGFDHQSRLDPVAIIGTGKRTVHLAMPCKAVPETALPTRPGSLHSVKREITIVLPTSEDIEEFEVDA
eukprot:11559170-Heterocapsa_arctica.AAC.1